MIYCTNNQILHPAYEGQELSFEPALDYSVTKLWLRSKFPWFSEDDFEDRYHTALELFLRWTPNPNVLPLTAVRRIFQTCGAQVSRVEPLDNTSDEYCVEGIDYTDDGSVDEGKDTKRNIPDALVFTPDEHKLAFKLAIEKVKLSPQEVRVLRYKLEGYTDEEATELMGWNRQRVNYVYLNSVLPKIKRALVS